MFGSSLFNVVTSYSDMQLDSRKYIYFLIFLGIWAVIPTLEAQEVDISNLSEEDDARREEIQRYFGYEDLLFRYLTLPYDVSANVNQQGKYVEIGFVLFALIPITLLYLLRGHKKWFYGTLAGSIIYLSLCMRFSFLFDQRNAMYNPVSGEISPELLIERWDGKILEPIYTLAGWIGAPVYKMFGAVTGPQDHITYPLLVLFFLGVVYYLSSIKMKSSLRVIALVGICYAFLWWLLSGGIIWYGFLIFPIGYVLSLYGIKKAKKEKAQVYPVFRGLAIGVIGIWLILAYISRISNINVLMDPDHPDLGKMIVESRFFPYTIGMIGARQCVDISAKNIDLALERMNADSSLIYQIGTSLAFEINNNQMRMFEDNNLSYFFYLINRYNDKKTFTDVLKANGFKYIIVDLRLPTLDRTPEQSLREKYSILMGQVIADNPDLRLLATDRSITVKDDNGNNRAYMAVFGQDIAVFGTYAVYEII